RVRRRAASNLPTESEPTSSTDLLEISMIAPPEPMATSSTATLVRTILTSSFSPPSPDASGITWDSHRGVLVESDGEVDEMNIYRGANVWELTTTGTVTKSWTTVGFSDEPTGVAFNPNNLHLFLSDDTGTRSVYELNPGPDEIYRTSDDIVTSFKTGDFGSGDPEGVTYDASTGVLYVVDGVNREVYRVHPGPNGRFDGVTSDDQVTHWDTQNKGLDDPEGIAYNADTGTLFVVGKPSSTVFEFSTTGTLLQTIDISQANASKPAGLTFAPGSVDSSSVSLYVAARGVDNDSNPNENDGRIYEMFIPGLPSGNRPPVAVNDTGTVNEGATRVVNAPGLLSNDSDPDGDTLTVNPIPVSGPSNGTLTLSTNGAYTYTHNGSETTSDSFVYEVSDGKGGKATATVTLTVNPVNDPPVAVNDSGTVGRGGTLTVPAPGLLSNDSDPEGNSLSVNTTPVVAPSNGAVTLSANGSWSYTHNGNATTSDSFVYRISDGNGGTATAVVTITVTVPNDPPVANADAFTVAEGGTLNVVAPGVLGNDTDPNGGPLTASLVSGPSNGLLTFNANGSFTYVHNGSETTADSFVYRAIDPLGATSTATASITITPVNDPPVAVADAHTVTQGNLLTVAAPGVLGNDTDAEGTALTAVLVSGTSHGALSLSSNGSFTYLPNAGYSGSDSFTYRASDGLLSSNIATVAIAVLANLTSIEVRVSASSDDAEERATLSMNLTSSDLELVFDKDNQTVGMRFNGIAIPRNAQILNAYIQFQVDEASSEATSLTIRGQAVNNASTFSTTSGDIAARPRTTAAVSWSPPPWNTMGAAGPDQRTPNLAPVVQEIVNRGDWVSGSSMAILVSGTGKRTAEAYDGVPAAAPLLHVDYGPGSSNQAPMVDITAPNDGATFNQGATISFTGTASDAEDGNLSASLSWSSDLDGSLGSGGSVSRTLSVGLHIIRAVVSDSGGLTSSDQITVTVVVPGNQTPVATNDAYSVMQGATLNRPAPGVLANDTDGNGDSLTAVLETSTTHGALSLSANGSFTYTPNSGYSGSDSFTYRAYDGQASSNLAMVDITVIASSGVLDIRVSVSSDDGEEQAGGSVNLTSSDLELTFDKSDQTVGMRFNGVSIPKSAVITSAFVQFQVDQATSEVTSLTIRGQAADNAATFSSTSGNISSRPPTTAAVSWSPPAWTSADLAGPDQRTPNIASVIQQIVNRSGWVSGNSIAIIITGTGKRTAEAYDGVATAAPLLHVEYQIP
ncbi:MAG TPA: Ig-like domain-containing protein, partial [Vicinamibacteria bacterium]|nr:Ig-like domain-containing protein [Vicinamibacteria bacterium]